MCPAASASSLPFPETSGGYQTSERERNRADARLVPRACSSPAGTPRRRSVSLYLPPFPLVPPQVASLKQQLEQLLGGRGVPGGGGGGGGSVAGGCGPVTSCGRSLAAMERAHRQALAELQRQHERQAAALEGEKERLLREEAAATARGQLTHRHTRPPASQPGSISGSESLLMFLSWLQHQCERVR